MRLVLFYFAVMASVLTTTWAPWQIGVPVGVVTGALVGSYWQAITEWLAGGLVCEKRTCLRCRMHLRALRQVRKEAMEEAEEAVRIWRERMAKDAQGRTN